MHYESIYYFCFYKNQIEQTMVKIKSLFTLMCLLCCTTLAVAQSDILYRPFLKDGKYWKCQMAERIFEQVGEIDAFYDQTTTFNLCITGDTIISEQVYKKILKETLSIDKELILTYPSEASENMEKQIHIDVFESALYPQFLRESDRKVYALREDCEKEYVLYDFSVNAGEKLSKDFPIEDTFVHSIDTVTANGQQFRRFELEPFGGYEPIWVEGVGHIGGPFVSTMSVLNDGRSYKLLSCYEDGKCIFTQKDFRSEPGVDRIEDLSPALSKGEGAVFDLQGRRLNAVPAKGLYIKNGKKFVSK